MKLLDGNLPSDLQTAASLLLAGRLVALPSETVYGLAALALDASAALKIFQAKDRPLADPLIVHLGTGHQLDKIARVTPSVESLARAFWPGPLTLVLPKHPSLPDLVTGGQSTVAVRFPSHPVFRAVLDLVQVPLAAPSANPFGGISPTSAQHVIHGLAGRIDAVVDGGPSQHGLESTIIGVASDHLTLLRPGPIAPAAIESASGLPVILPEVSTAASPSVPGGFLRHYSPTKNLSLVPRQELLESAPPQTARVFLSPSAIPLTDTLILSQTADPVEVGQVLYATLHQLDRDPCVHQIWIERPPTSESWRTVNDRLYRAAANH